MEKYFILETKHKEGIFLKEKTLRLLKTDEKNIENNREKIEKSFKIINIKKSKRFKDLNLSEVEKEIGGYDLGINYVIINNQYMHLIDFDDLYL